MLKSFAESTLFGEVYGDGPVRVVWLHGWARRGGDFAHAANTLARHGVASVALDLPGFGSSPLPRVAGGARYYGELLVPALREITDEPLVLVGHSYGGTVAAVIASTHPELVRALVLTGAPLLRRGAAVSPPWAYRATRWLHAKGVVSESRMEAARQRYGSSDYRAAHGLMREILVASVNESYEAELSTIDVPVDFIWGALDRDVPVSVSESAARLLRGTSTSRVLDGVGHLVPSDAPDALVAGVERALRS